MSELTCADRIDEELKRVQEDIELYFEDPGVYENGNEDLPSFHEYGLCFDYVEPETFVDQECGYYRYQLSWGGPSDEIRFFPDGRIEYWFMDWFDGAKRNITKESWARQLRREFEEVGCIDWSKVQLYAYC